jgi:hypothetical protein
MKENEIHVFTKLLNDSLNLIDLNIKEPNLESIIRTIYINEKNN